MRILFLSQLLPYPLDAGPKIRSYYVLRHLLKNHDVSLVCFIRESDPPQAVDHIKSICPESHFVILKRSPIRNVVALLRSILTGKSWLIARDHNRDMRSLLGHLVQKTDFDYIHADQLWMAPYALATRDSTPSDRRPRIVLDQHNAVHLIPKRMAENARTFLFRSFLDMESARIARYESQVCQAFDKVVWVSEQDYEAVNQVMPVPSQDEQEGFWDSPTVIPICQDPDGIEPIDSLTEGSTLLFVGGFHWPPNVEGLRWFLQQVFPIVRDKVPGATLLAVGKNPPPEFLNKPGVVAPGYVEDLAHSWRSSRIFIVPLLSGGGMRVKILDAWTYGLPVVSTSIGAEGLSYIDGENIIIADHAEAFAQALINLLGSRKDCVRVCSAGRVNLENTYNWKKVYSSWDQIYL